MENSDIFNPLSTKEDRKMWLIRTKTHTWNVAFQQYYFKATTDNSKELIHVHKK